MPLSELRSGAKNNIGTGLIISLYDLPRKVVFRKGSAAAPSENPHSLSHRWYAIMGFNVADFSVKARRAFTTKEGFLRMIQTKETENMKKNEAKGQGTWSNVDLDPTPPQQRNWSAWHFFAFQFSISFSPTTYNVGASLIAVGLSWWIILVASGK
jgi:hypothetical protein